MVQNTPRQGREADKDTVTNMLDSRRFPAKNQCRQAARRASPANRTQTPRGEKLWSIRPRALTRDRAL
jgi:hypothetical protein